MSRCKCEYCEKPATHKMFGIPLCDSDECARKLAENRHKAFQFIASIGGRTLI